MESPLPVSPNCLNTTGTYSSTQRPCTVTSSLWKLNQVTAWESAARGPACKKTNLFSLENRWASDRQLYRSRQQDRAMRREVPWSWRWASCSLENRAHVVCEIKRPRERWGRTAGGTQNSVKDKNVTWTLGVHDATEVKRGRKFTPVAKTMQRMSSCHL
jgi:hypothetical protein